MNRADSQMALGVLEFTQSKKTTLKRVTLLGTKIAPFKGIFGLVIFLFARWDTLVPWRGPSQDLSSLAWAVATARAKDSAAVALLRQADVMSLDVRKALLFV